MMGIINAEAQRGRGAERENLRTSASLRLCASALNIILVTFAASVALAASFTPLADTEELEPSIINEVEHALSLARAALASTNAPPAISTPIPISTPTSAPTNNSSFIIHNSSFSLSERAISLVSSQKSDGRWYDGTNDVTAIVVPILESMLE